METNNIFSEQGEIWKDISGFDGDYKISSFGRVWSKNKSKDEGILKPGREHSGYLRVMLYRDGKIVACPLVHRLVAEGFIPNPDRKPQVNHIDEDKANNTVENLEWMTAKENANFGTRNQRAGLKHSKQILQYSLAGEFLREWPSAHEVERQLGFFQSGISNCCLGKYRQAYGFLWRYKEV